MSLSTPFIDRPIATTLLTVGVALAGIAAYRVLPVSPLPQVDFPTISVSASLGRLRPSIPCKTRPKREPAGRSGSSAWAVAGWESGSVAAAGSVAGRVAGSAASLDIRMMRAIKT